jgi:hypothetical protein
MRRSSKLDIRLEVLEQFRIYLMPDVISQLFGITRLLVCERQIGTDDGRPAFANLPSLKATAKDRAEMPNGKRL